MNDSAVKILTDSHNGKKQTGIGHIVDCINFRDTILTDFRKLIEEGFMDWAVFRNTNVSDKYFRCSNSLNVEELKRYMAIMNQYYDVQIFEGTFNEETKFVLDYFGIAVPKSLQDVKLQIKDI